MIRSATLTFPTAPVMPSDNNRICLLAGTSNVMLANEVARYLGTELTPMIRKSFADGEIYVQILESIHFHVHREQILMQILSISTGVVIASSNVYNGLPSQDMVMRVSGVLYLQP